MNRASASGSIDLRFDSKSGQTNDLKTVKEYSSTALVLEYCTRVPLLGYSYSQPPRTRLVIVLEGQCTRSNQCTRSKKAPSTRVHLAFNRSDGRVVQSVCFWNGRLGVRFRVGSNQWLKNWYSQLPCLTFSMKGTVWRKPASLLVVPLRKALNGIPHLSVVDRWPATPKRARTALRRFLVIGG